MRKKRKKQIIFWIGLIIIYLIGMAFILHNKYEQYVPATNLSEMPSKRAEVSGLFHDDKIFIIGGWEPVNGDSDLVEAYDPNTDSWSSYPSLPRALHHIGTASVDGMIYVVGGFYTVGKGFVEVDTVYRFDGKRWKQLASMPTARAGLGVAVYENKMYAIGGHANGRDLTTLEIYDIQTDTWEKGPSMAVPRGHLSVVKLDNLIYAIGGREADTCYFDIFACRHFESFNTVEVFDPASHTWEKKDSPLIARSGLGTAALNDRIYIFGGETVPPYKTYAHLEEYNPSTNEVTMRETDAVARHNIGMVAYGGSLYVVGGGIVDAFDASNLTQRLNFRS